MKEIKCPKCGTVISIDEKDYAEILSQVKGVEFQAELDKQVKLIEEKLAAQNALKENAISQENEKNNQKFSSEIKDLKAALEKANQDKELAIVKAVNEVKESSFKQLESQKYEIESLKKELETKVNEICLKKDNQIAILEKDLEGIQNVHKNEISQLEISKNNELKQKDDLIQYYKDLKTKMSTKLLGETLEQHCMFEFNKLRTSMYPNAYFEKDNKVSEESGSKGDFIFRDFEDGIEYISIMFDMKNESDTTSTKKTNESFLKELDKDRREKNCEYAVLVSMLEPESEFYNQGIVDMSYVYPKTYVIRPQLFVAMITLLTNAAKKSLDAVKELDAVKKEQYDITNFEEKLTEFQNGFKRNYVLASNHFDEAIERINKSIKELEKTRDELIGCQNNLRLANDKAQDVTIRKLTKNSPSLKAKFEAIENSSSDFNEDSK